MRMDDIGWHSVHGADFLNERPHGTGDFVLLLIKSPCQVSVNGQMRKFPPYTLILYTPDCYVKYGADGAEYADDWLHFAPDDAESALIGQLRIPMDTPVALPKGTEISKLLREMSFMFYSAHLHRQEITDLLFRMLLYRIHEQLVQAGVVPEGESVRERLKQIKEFIFRKPFDNFSAERFAGELNLTVADFLTQYRAENGSIFEEDLVRTRMQYIADQMRVHLAEEQTVEEIAQIAGYVSESEFTKEFTRLLGFTPQAHLDRLRAEAAKA